MNRPKLFPSNGRYTAALFGLLVATAVFGKYAIDMLTIEEVEIHGQYDRLQLADSNVKEHTLRGKPITERDGKRWLLASSNPQSGSPKWLDVTDASIDPRQFDHGIGLDSIPSIDAPAFGSKDDERWSERKLPEDALVIGVEFEGEVRAYPVNFMGRHELVNDTFGDTHLTVAY